MPTVEHANRAYAMVDELVSLIAEAHSLTVECTGDPVAVRRLADAENALRNAQRYCEAAWDVLPKEDEDDLMQHGEPGNRASYPAPTVEERG